MKPVELFSLFGPLRRHGKASGQINQELGPGHYEGRGWRGFHHHATLCTAARSAPILPPNSRGIDLRLPASTVGPDQIKVEFGMVGLSDELAGHAG
jgi:hypothetical protein